MEEEVSLEKTHDTYWNMCYINPIDHYNMIDPVAPLPIDTLLCLIDDDMNFLRSVDTV